MLVLTAGQSRKPSANGKKQILTKCDYNIGKVKFGINGRKKTESINI
jgi:hypothetical protein